MAKYTTRIQMIDGKVRATCTRPDLLNRWLKNHVNQWVWLDLEPIVKQDDPKTAEQLGYYWGLLVEEITEQLNVEKKTIPIELFKFRVEVPYFSGATHELLTQICGRVGKNGALLRVSEMEKFQMMMFLDNVLKFAVDSLSMNGQKLEAWITKREAIT